MCRSFYRLFLPNLKEKSNQKYKREKISQVLYYLFKRSQDFKVVQKNSKN